MHFDGLVTSFPFTMLRISAWSRSSTGSLPNSNVADGSGSPGAANAGNSTAIGNNAGSRRQISLLVIGRGIPRGRN